MGHSCNNCSVKLHMKLIHLIILFLNNSGIETVFIKDDNVTYYFNYK